MTSFTNLINDKKPVLVDFYADWCGPCKTMAPFLEEVAVKMKDKVKVIKVDVDKNKTAALKYNVKSIPTLILFRDGKIEWRKAGVVDVQSIIKEVDKVV